MLSEKLNLPTVILKIILITFISNNLKYFKIRHEIYVNIVFMYIIYLSRAFVL